MKTFKQPLSAKEEDYYLKQYKQDKGDNGKMARDILIERNLRLVAHVAKKYSTIYEDMEDLISIGTIGLMKAIQTYDEQKGSRLATYAAKCIDNELLMMFRNRKKFAREVSLYEPIGTDKEGNEISLLDVYGQEATDIVEQIDLTEKSQLINRLIKSQLDQRERCVIELRFGLANGEEMTQKAIGNMLHISRSYVSRIEKKALLKLKNGLIKAGF